MDGIIPVAAQVQAPDATKTMGLLSSILNVKQQQQDLQTGAYRQQGVQAEAQQQQQTAGQRQAAAQFFQNYDVASHVGPDGTIDLDQALTNPQLKATGDAYPAIAKSLIDMKNAQLDGKTKLAALNGSLRQQFYDNVGGLSADPDVKDGNNQGVGKVLDAIDEFGQSGGPDAARVAAVYRPIIENLQKAGKTNKLQEVLGNFQLQASDAGKQREQTYGTPTTVDTGGTITGGVQAPAAAGGGVTTAGSAIPKTLAPTEQPGYRATVTNVPLDAERFSQISNENQRGQTMVALSNQVSQLADQVRTGKLSKEWTDRLAVLAQNNPGITARQMLSKYAAQLKTMAEGGASTDAERGQIEAGMPNPDSMDPAAVKEAAQYVGGIGALRKARNDVASAYVQKNGTNGVRAVDDQFMQHADPFVYMYRNLPAGQERQQFLLKKYGDGKKITDRDGLQKFLDQQNIVKHYGG